MSEKGVYTVAITNYVNTAEQVVCRCGRVIGRIVTVEDRDMLVINDGLVSHHDEVCMICRQPFHYCVTDRMLAKLIEHIKGAG